MEQRGELLNAIRTVYQNQSYIPPQVGAKLAERMSAPQLSDRELEVLRLIAKGKTNPQISAELTIAESTVRFHITHILSKLGADDRTWLTDTFSSVDWVERREIQRHQRFRWVTLTLTQPTKESGFQELCQSISDRTQAVITAISRGIVSL